MDDDPILTETIRKELVQRTGKPITGLSKATLNIFLDYPWLGNVRELKSALEFAFVVSESGLIEPQDLPNHIFSNQQDVPHESMDTGTLSGEKAALIAALKKTGGNRSKAARILGVTRTTVWNRINKYNLKLEQGIKVS